MYSNEILFSSTDDADRAPSYNRKSAICNYNSNVAARLHDSVSRVETSASQVRVSQFIAFHVSFLKWEGSSRKAAHTCAIGEG